MSYLVLARKYRPQVFSDIVGQDELLGDGGTLQRAVTRGSVPSCVLWGPPGTGKTTIGRLLADVVKARFVPFSGPPCPTERLWSTTSGRPKSVPSHSLVCWSMCSQLMRPLWAPSKPPS